MHTEGGLRKLAEDDCPTKTHGKSLVCDECGRAFQTPILATVSISGQTQTYYACPRCMTKVSSPVQTVESKKQTAEQIHAVNCRHFFGFLNKHQRNMSFPDECLTCTRMVECMLLH